MGRLAGFRYREIARKLNLCGFILVRKLIAGEARQTSGALRD